MALTYLFIYLQPIKIRHHEKNYFNWNFRFRNVCLFL